MKYHLARKLLFQKKFLSVLLLLCFFTLSAQQTTFRIQYDVALFDLPGGIVQSPNGNYVFSGTNATFGTTGHVFQIDGNGVVIWSKAYSAGGLSTQISDVKNATNNQYIVTGGTGSGCLLMRLDNTGAVVGANRYRVSSSSGSNEYGNKVIQSSDGGFVVAGSVSHVDPDGVGPLARQDSSKLFCMKANSAGVLQWMRVFFVTTAFDDDDYFYDVAEVSDGYLFVGYTTVVAGDGQSDAVILKTDFNGALQWSRKWGSGNSEGVYAIINNGTNEVIISGDDNARAFLLRVNTPNSGPSITGTNSIYATGGFSALGSSLVKTIDNHFTIFGTRIGFTLVPPFLDFSAFILKTNSSTGAVLFNRTYNSGFISILPTGLQSTDTGYVMNSVSATIPPGAGAYDYGVVKADKNGQQNAGSGCPESSPTFTRSNYAPTLNAFTPTIVTTSSTNSISPVVANITPTQNVVCLDVICIAPPMPTVTSSQNNICPGTQVQISASGSGANVTYNVFTVPSNGTSIGTAPLNVSLSTTTTYYVEASDNTNPPCVSPRGSVTVTVLPLPANPGTVTGQNNPCPGSQNYSVGNVANATSYNWSVSGGGTITGGQGTTGITINWTTVGGPYTVSVTASNTCGNTSSTLQVDVAGTPNTPGTISGANPTSPGNHVYSIGAVNGATGYTWSLSGGGTINSGQGTTSATINWGTTPGAYTLSVVTTNLCGSSAAASLNVTVNPGPPTAPSLINGEVNPCPGPQNYSISPVADATGYTWSLSSGGTITSGQNTTSISIDWTTTGGPYTISVTADNSCGSSSPATLNIDVQSGPPNAPTTVIGEINPCPGNENYSVAMVSGATTYNWSVSGGGTISSGQGTNIISVGWTQPGGPYTVSVIAENACGISAPATLDVNVKPGPPASPGTITGNTSICKGREVYSIASVPTATSYDWTVFSGGTILSGQGTISLTVDWTAPGTTNDISVTASNDCGTSTPSFLTVTILPDTPAIPGIINGNISVCPGPENYSIGAITGATTYNWSMSGGGTISAGQGSTNVTLNWATPGIHTISVSSSNLCGTSAARTLDVTVNPVPTLPNVMLSDDSICPGEAVIITASGSTGGTVSYNFYNNITGGNLLGTSPLTVNPNSTTTYYLNVSNEFGCKISGRVPVQVYVFTPPSGNITAPDKSVCFNDSATLTASSTGSNVVFTWWDNSNGGNLLGTGATYTTPQLQQNATYYVQMQSSDGCVSQTARATVEVTVIPTPLVELICDDPDQEIIAGQTVRFDALPDDLDGYEFFVNGVGVQTGSQSFYVTNSLRDYDTVSVLAIDNGCHSERDSIVIRVREIANAFTPDGDGVNDLFLKDFELIILNRWGQELYTGIGGWDGTYKGRDVSPGTYYYIVTIKDATNKDRVGRGALMLIRN